jgi:hypothetical protein
MCNKRVTSSKIVKELFINVHKEYCEHFKQFNKRLNIILKDNLNDDEVDNIVDWAIEYKNSMETSKDILEELEEQIKAKRFELSDYRIRENEKFTEVSNCIMPMAIIYFMALNMKDNNALL